jgi:hypothetical protein
MNEMAVDWKQNENNARKKWDTHWRGDVATTRERTSV